MSSLRYLVTGALIVALAAASQPDLIDALVGIAHAAQWQRVAWVGLVCVGGCLGMLGGLVVLGFAWGAWDCWRHWGRDT